MIGELTSHLWQSTFFAAAAGLLTIGFRRNRAQVRYWLWLSASLKFLIPFSLLISLGSHIDWAPSAHRIATNIAEKINTPAVTYTIEQFNQPLFPAKSPAPTRGAFDWLPAALLGIWLCGFAATTLMRTRAWLRVRAAIRTSTATNISTTVQVRISPGPLEPGVVGLLRPVLLLPEGIVERLTPAELEAVLAHEICHVRRRDNLFGAIHMAVEAVFWFHPLVWWIGAHLLEERERACDEEVIRQGNQRGVYADAILNVCKLYAESPLACVSGVSGANIKRRIKTIMTNPVGQSLTGAKKTLLAGAGIVALATPIVIGLLTGLGDVPMILAQSSTATGGLSPAAPRLANQPQSQAAPKPKFDVVSVKPCGPDSVVTNADPSASGEGGSFKASPGLLRISCASIMTMIQVAYVWNGDKLKNNSMAPAEIMTGGQRVRGVPGWAMAARYTIEAKTNNPVANGPTTGPYYPPAQKLMNGLMLQSLLEDRFQLKTHRETEEAPMYALVVAKGGFKGKPMQGGDCTEPEKTPEGGTIIRRLQPGDKPYCDWMGGDPHGPNRTIVGGGIPISRLADYLSMFVTDRHVFDKTGLTTLFNIHLEFGPDESTPCKGYDCPVDLTSDIPAAPSIFTALEEQLGLKLEPTKGPREYIMVDHVERPSGN